MANVLTGSVTVGTPIKSGEDASYPATNVALYTHPYRVWKAPGLTTSTWIGYDLGSAVAVKAVMVDRINIANGIVEADDDAAFGSIEWYSDSAVPTAFTRDEYDGRYKHCWHNSGTTLFTNRYFRIRYTSGGATDGGSVMTVGSLVVSTDAATWAQTFESVAVTPFQAAVANDFVGGGREATLVGNLGAEINCTGRFKASQLAATQTVLRYGEHATWLFHRNFAGDEADCYLVKRVGASSIQQLSAAHYGIDRLTLREVV